MRYLGMEGEGADKLFSVRAAKKRLADQRMTTSIAASNASAESYAKRAKAKDEAATAEAYAKAEAAAAAANPVGYIRPREAAALLDKEEAARLDKIAADKPAPAATSGERPAVVCPVGDVISFYDKILPAYSNLPLSWKMRLTRASLRP